jgi:hypothetical protein
MAINTKPWRYGEPLAKADYMVLTPNDYFAREFTARRTHNEFVLNNGQQFSIGDIYNVRNLKYAGNIINAATNPSKVVIGRMVPRGLDDFKQFLQIDASSAIAQFSSGKLCKVLVQDGSINTFCLCGISPCKHRLATFYLFAGHPQSQLDISQKDHPVLCQHREQVRNFLDNRASSDDLYRTAATGFFLTNLFHSLHLNESACRQLLGEYINAHPRLFIPQTQNEILRQVAKKKGMSPLEILRDKIQT